MILNFLNILIKDGFFNSLSDKLSLSFNEVKLLEVFLLLKYSESHESNKFKGRDKFNFPVFSSEIILLIEFSPNISLSFVLEKSNEAQLLIELKELSIVSRREPLEKLIVLFP